MKNLSRLAMAAALCAAFAVPSFAQQTPSNPGNPNKTIGAGDNAGRSSGGGAPLAGATHYKRWHVSRASCRVVLKHPSRYSHARVRSCHRYM